MSMLHLLRQRPHTPVWNLYSFLSSDTSKQVFLPVLDRINHSPLCITELYSCTIPKNPVLLLNHSAQKLHHQLECFNFKFDFNLNWLDDVNFNHLSKRTLCVTPHIGHQFMSWYFNVHAQGIANYK